MNTNRLGGIILIVVGLFSALITVMWLFSNEALVPTARILGLGLQLLATRIASSKRRPFAASRSMFGVRASGLP